MMVYAFTERQKAVLSIIPHVTGTLSCLGSGFIIHDVLSNRKKTLKRVFNRLMLSFSCYDMLVSACIALSTWPIPKGTPGVYAAVGSTQTCTAQGFILQLGVATPLYNCHLATYSMLVLNDIPESFITTRFEICAHIATAAFAFGTACAGLALRLYNSEGLWCWISAFPAGCDDESMECTRGMNAHIYLWVFYCVPLVFSLLYVTFVIALLVNKVRRLERKAILEMEMNQRHDDFVGSEPTPMISLTCALCSSFDVTIDDEKAEPRITPLRKKDRLGRKMKRTRQVFRQALLFIGAFYMTWAAGCISRVTSMISGRDFYTLVVLHTFFVPAQGIFNLLVYQQGRIAV